MRWWMQRTAIARAVHPRRWRVLALGGLGVGAALAVGIVRLEPWEAAEAGREPGHSTAMKLTSEVIQPEGNIPFRYACGGVDVSPPITWSDVPPETQSLMLLLEDRDARRTVHWVVFNLPPDSTGLPERIPRDVGLASGGLQGSNSFGEVGYHGACPPPGRVHHYRFTLYALDSTLDLGLGAAPQEVALAMRDHVLAKTFLHAAGSRARGMPEISAGGRRTSYP